MSRATTLWSGTYIGKLPKVNAWHSAKTGGGCARIFETPAFKRQKEDLAVSLPKPSAPITEAVDAVIELALWKQVDTDAPIKGVLDALEMAGVIANDRQIRNLVVHREYHKRGEPDRLAVRLISIVK